MMDTQYLETGGGRVEAVWFRFNRLDTQRLENPPRAPILTAKESKSEIQHQ